MCHWSKSEGLIFGEEEVHPIFPQRDYVVLLQMPLSLPLTVRTLRSVILLLHSQKHPEKLDFQKFFPRLSQYWTRITSWRDRNWDGRDYEEKGRGGSEMTGGPVSLESAFFRSRSSTEYISVG